MNKIAVVLSCNLHWAPYYARYEKMLLEMQENYDLIIWNRENLNEQLSSNVSVIEFNLQDETNNGSAKKIIKFIKYARFVQRTIQNNGYSKVVFLGTYAWIPALLSGYLERKFKGNYWVDLRDITYEHNPIFYKLEEKALQNAKHVVISSKGYLPFLPKNNYGYIHNIDASMDDIFCQYKKSTSDKIRISYIGNIAYWNSVKEFIDVFGNDLRYTLIFAGSNSERVREYCLEKNITNVSISGKFERLKTVLFYNETDIVYNVYGNDIVNVRTASSNKLYYAMKFHLPLLVSADTYMEQICQQYNIGFTFENTKEFPDKLYDAYMNMDIRNPRYDEAFEDACREDNECTVKFKEFINE